MKKGQRVEHYLKWTRIKITSVFSSETSQETEGWHATFEVLRGKQQPAMLVSTKLFFKGIRNKDKQTIEGIWHHARTVQTSSEKGKIL